MWLSDKRDAAEMHCGKCRLQDMNFKVRIYFHFLLLDLPLWSAALNEQCLKMARNPQKPCEAAAAAAAARGWGGG